MALLARVPHGLLIALCVATLLVEPRAWWLPACLVALCPPVIAALREWGASTGKTADALPRGGLFALAAVESLVGTLCATLLALAPQVGLGCACVLVVCAGVEALSPRFECDVEPKRDGLHVATDERILRFEWATLHVLRHGPHITLTGGGRRFSARFGAARIEDILSAAKRHGAEVAEVPFEGADVKASFTVALMLSAAMTMLGNFPW